MELGDADEEVAGRSGFSSGFCAASARIYEDPRVPRVFCQRRRAVEGPKKEEWPCERPESERTTALCQKGWARPRYSLLSCRYALITLCARRFRILVAEKYI